MCSIIDNEFIMFKCQYCDNFSKKTAIRSPKKTSLTDPVYYTGIPTYYNPDNQKWKYLKEKYKKYR